MEQPPDERNAEQRPVDPNVREAREHIREARDEMRLAWESLLPPGWVEHRRAARREFLLAMRGYLNAAIDRIDRVAREDTRDLGSSAPPKSANQGNQGTYS